MLKKPDDFIHILENEEQAQLIRRTSNFLLLCEKRQLEAASEYLAPKPRLTFPGGLQYDNLYDMVADANGRYKWVRKHHSHFDVYRNGDGDLVVVVFGTLEGENLDGERFQGVRFQDRFVFRDKKIIEQQVWNDLGASGVLK